MNKNAQRLLKVFNRILYVASAALTVAAMILTVAVKPAQADSAACNYKLNLSHIQCVNNQVEVHFVLLDVPDWVTPGSVTFAVKIDNGSVNTYTITPANHTGNVWHYYWYGTTNGKYNVTSAYVWVNGYKVDLHNPGDYKNDNQNCVVATSTPTKTTVPPTATNTSVPPTATFTSVPPTATFTDVPPTATNTDVPPTATFTDVPPTATNTDVPPTETLVPPTDTPEIPTDTAVPPTETVVPPTDTPEIPTDTAVPPTGTPVPPTQGTPEEPTATIQPPTPTIEGPTPTVVIPTSTVPGPTSTPIDPTPTKVGPTKTNVPPPAVLDPLKIEVDPFCNAAGQMQWTVINPNSKSFNVEHYTVDGVSFGGMSVPPGEHNLTTTSLGTHTVVIYWGEGQTVSLTYTIEVCQLPAPTGGSPILIPVTGADHSGQIGTGLFFASLSLAGLGLMLNALRKLMRA